MYSIDILKEEHANISRMLEILKSMCCKVLEGAEVSDEDMRRVIDFIKKYVEDFHHHKEENFLYSEMLKVSPTAETMVNGMMADHVSGHKYMLSFENALDLYNKNPKTEYKLDILTQAMNYAKLMKLNTDKESNVVYSFAKSGLSPEIQEEIDAKVKEQVEDPLHKDVINQQLGHLVNLAAKYE